MAVTSLARADASKRRAQHHVAETREPHLAKPITEKEDPKVRWDLKDKELPRWTKSKIETDEPSRHIPYSEAEDPNRLKERIDMELPIDAKSKELKEEPSLQRP